MTATETREDLRLLALEYDDMCRTLDRTTLPESVLQEADHALWGVTQRLCREIDQAGQDELLTFRQGPFHSNVLRWFCQHPQTARLWQKPAGYSGDHATIEWLCANKQGWGELPEIFSNHVLRCTMAQQHREKVREQRDFVLSCFARRPTGLEMADLGCGPSLALKEALALIQAVNAHIVLVDLDPAALARSRQHLAPYTEEVRFEYCHRDVVQWLRSMSRLDQRFDVITVGGLFDYLPDRAAVFVIEKACRMLKADGRLFFTQVCHANPDEIFMDWWGDWRLIQRDEEEVISLCQRAGLSREALSMRRERTNCAVLVTVSV